MTGIFFRKTLSFKHMPKMPATVRTEDFRSQAISILAPFHRSRDLIIKTRPAAMGIELVPGVIEWGITPLTGVDSRFLVAQVFPGPGAFCSFMDDHSFFLIRQRVSVVRLCIQVAVHNRQDSYHKRQKSHQDNLKII